MRKMMKFKENTVFNVDCFELIKVIPDKCLDLVLVDPPYGDGIGYGRKNKTIKNNEDVSINLRFLDAVYPKMKCNTSLYIFSNHKYYKHILEHAVKIGLTYRMKCIMVKNNIGMGHPFRNQYEICLVFEKGKPEYYRKDVSNVWKMKHITHTNRTHPHKKDYDIMRRIILHSTKVGDLVFDGFMGAFTTAIACHKEGRKFIGAELDEKWFEQGIRKLNEFKNTPELFAHTS